MMIAANVTAQPSAPPTHPLGSRARVLLCSVFGPYAQDDEYGSRLMNPMELYHNQVTRGQGPFSLRMFHRSWGLMMIQCNIEAPCVLLDFPTLDRFIQELKEQQYDVIGVGAIPPNFLKVRKMCELIRQYQPRATIVIGGHIANMPDLDERIDADHIVRGEGIAWMRRYLGEDATQPIRHPEIKSGIGTRCMGVQVRDKPGDVAATVIPSVGCPLGCNFCSTSAMFGGKGKFIDFYQSGDELFEIMCHLETAMQVQSFFIMDENFLLHRRRALRLLELMQQHDKAWSLYVFSSANVLSNYTIEQLVGLGVDWIWLGLEGNESKYTKLRNINTRTLVGQYQSHGIHVLGSTIIGMEDHTPDNIDEVIDYGVSHNTDFHQFMLYTPVVGTPLHAELTAQGRMMDESEFDLSDIHGQSVFNYRHPHITGGQETEFMVRAFERDFRVNGPSVARIVGTTLAGWQRYKHHAEPRIRRRVAWQSRELPTAFAATVWAARRYFRDDAAIYTRLSKTLGDLYREFGLKARLSAALGGRYVLHKIRQEQRRLATGWTYEPPTFYETNVALEDAPAGKQPAPCRFITPGAATEPALV
ncbi:MAG: cobalamin-dependent protein [Planctomycetes bacterium]|nr:cobalamin-dependent protein [Planctomycetota bacterium]